MESQNTSLDSTKGQTSATANITMQDPERLTLEYSPQQKFGTTSRDQKPIFNSYAPPMQISVNSANVMPQQPANAAQPNLPPIPQASNQNDHQQDMPGEPQQQQKLQQDVPQQQQQQQLQQQQQQQQPQPQQQGQQQQPQQIHRQVPPQYPPIKPLLTDTSTITMPSQTDAPRNQALGQKQESPSSQKTIITKVKLSDELNIFDWFRTKEIISQIAERAKSSVDSVITTLDPGMKEYLYSGGNVNIVVISDNGCLVGSIRDAFQSVFGRATVTAARYDSSSVLAAYPIRTACGLQEAVRVSQERIKKLRKDTNSVPQNQVVVAVQPTLVCMNAVGTESLDSSSANGNKISETDTKKWFYTYCMFIEDPVLNVNLNCYSQFIPIDTDVVESAKAVQLPAEFTEKHLGFAGTIDELMAYKLRLNPSNGFSDEYGCFWFREWAGIYETQIMHQLSLTLAQSYRRKWSDCAHIEVVS